MAVLLAAYLSSPSAASVMQVGQDQLTTGDFDCNQCECEDDESTSHSDEYVVRNSGVLATRLLVRIQESVFHTYDNLRSVQQTSSDKVPNRCQTYANERRQPPLEPCKAERGRLRASL